MERGLDQKQSIFGIQRKKYINEQIIYKTFVRYKGFD
jgi:hypothetical protein